MTDIELSMEEDRLLRTFIVGPRIHDAADLYKLVIQLEAKGLVTPVGVSVKYQLTDAGHDYVQREPVDEQH